MGPTNLDTQPVNMTTGEPLNLDSDWKKVLNTIKRILKRPITYSIAGLIVILVGTVVIVTHKTNAGIVALPPNLEARHQAEVLSLQAQNKYAQVHSAVSAIQVSGQAQSQQYEFYLDRGAAYESHQQYANALASYQKAQAVTNNYTINVAIGRTAQALGNKQLALSSYETAMGMVSLGPLADTERASLQADIQALN